jgi:hypothetical protein
MEVLVFSVASVGGPQIVTILE